jgi:hypothetical protein
MTVELWVAGITLLAAVVTLIAAFVQLRAARNENHRDIGFDPVRSSPKTNTSPTDGSHNPVRRIFSIGMILAAVGSLVLIGGLDWRLLRDQIQSIFVRETMYFPGNSISQGAEGNPDCSRVSDAVYVGTDTNVCNRGRGDRQYRWRGRENWCVPAPLSPRSYLCYNKNTGHLAWQNPPGL